MENAVTNLAYSAYLFPPGATTKTLNTNNFVMEATRIMNIFFVQNSTKMNPNMNYAQIYPVIAPYPLNDVSQIKFLNSSIGDPAGLITFSENIYEVIDALKIYEQISNSSDITNETARAELKATLVSVKNWFKQFL